MYILRERIQNFRFKVSLFFHVYISIYFLLIFLKLKFSEISTCIIEYITLCNREESSRNIDVFFYY